MATTGNPAGEFESQLRWYYSKHFPIDLFHRWLSYGDESYFPRREISFTLPGDVYLRFRSFANADELLETLKKQTPIKIDIGAVYNISPKERANVGASLVPLEKELVIDIDMTDYYDVMGDLKEGDPVDVCDRNWQYIAGAVQIVDTALREDFGFRHLLWVYSGRRGVHCWVADQGARSLSNEARSAIVSYLSVKMVSEDNAGRRIDDITNPLHPSLSRAKREVCEPLFNEFVLKDQGMMTTPQRIKQMLSFIPNPALREQLLDRLTSTSSKNWSGTDKWERVKHDLIKHSETKTADYILFHYTYPRLDVNVSRDLGHLLKGPFCVHPGTGRVCVPFRAEECEQFMPAKYAPHIENLIEDVNNVVKGQKEGEPSQYLNKAIKVFQEFVVGLEKEKAIAEEKKTHAKLSDMDRNGARDFLAV
ncbi:hypothetical protein NDN08_000871 [Rhodosorus marinus]|uniref:DNA primase n=1 Tax=Rhodosorus marinus TaxID=101924 RepID=A0AAV8UP87_9RHOD|nr:hypothetical protein NDN08_000871 [Rhodosorus marinus]